MNIVDHSGNSYMPDRWVVLKITSPDLTQYKILGGWSGGYLDGDSWRLSSRIVSIQQPGDGWQVFHNDSGSVYECQESHYGLNHHTAQIYNKMTQNLPSGFQVELLPAHTDWRQLDYV